MGERSCIGAPLRGAKRAGERKWVLSKVKTGRERGRGNESKEESREE